MAKAQPLRCVANLDAKGSATWQMLCSVTVGLWRRAGFACEMILQGPPTTLGGKNCPHRQNSRLLKVIGNAYVGMFVERRSPTEQAGEDGGRMHSIQSFPAF